MCPWFAWSSQTVTSPYTVYGRVIQPDNSPVVRAVVTITDQTGINRQVSTDDSGRFEIHDLPRGRFYLTAVNPDAPEQFSDPVIVELTLTAVSLVEANVYLQNRATREKGRGKRSGVISVGEERQGAPKPATKAFEQAVRLFNQNRYDESLKKLSRAIELYPSYFQAFAQRGHILLTLGKAPEAMGDFRRALELNSRYGPALRGSGLAQFQEKKYAESIEDLQRAADAEPGNATNYYFIGMAEVALDRRVQARASLQKALSIDPVSSIRAHVHLGTLLIKENRPLEAAREIEIYLEAVPTAPDAEKLRALLAQLRANPRQ